MTGKEINNAIDWNKFSQKFLLHFSEFTNNFFEILPLSK